MIYEKLVNIAKKSKSLVAIGSGNRDEYVQRTVQAAENAAKKGVARIIIVGNPEHTPTTQKTEFHTSPNPQDTLLKMLSSGEVDAIVRGSLPAADFLKNIKTRFNTEKLRRIALLETAHGHQFFFAPVGIDEGKTTQEKISFITDGVNLLERLEAAPRVAILSGGRAGDIGRDPTVDETIKQAQQVVEKTKHQNITQNIKNYQILIEDAIKEKANLILAPNGTSGNLIYRTLIHLGKGASYGAPYTNIPKTIIDTSRVGPQKEYIGAITLASALVKTTHPETQKHNPHKNPTNNSNYNNK
ncbi:MAG: methanogenesis marker protein Mmp4/MtxX [Candidatus Freyrarchaeum guaymaensis]